MIAEHFINAASTIRLFHHFFFIVHVILRLYLRYALGGRHLLQACIASYITEETLAMDEYSPYFILGKLARLKLYTHSL